MENVKNMNGFTKKNIRTLTLGEKLKKLRSDKRISLNEISRSTKIQVKYLEYLEQGNYDKLPADVYVKGFIRSYTDFLGMDERIFLRLYDKEKGIKKNLKKSNKAVLWKAKPINISPFIFTPKKFLILVTTVLILAGLFFLYREIKSFASVPRLIILSPNDNSQTNSNFVAVKGITDKDASVFINGQPILVDDNGNFRERLILQSGMNVIKTKAINKFKKENIKTITVRYNIQPSKKAISDETLKQNQNGADAYSEDKLKDQNVSNNSNNNQQNIKLEIEIDPGPVWINVKTDKNTVFSGLMMAGTSQIFQAKNKIVISSGRGNATHLKFNGKDIGVLSQRPGAVRGATFTKDTKYQGR